MAQKPRMLLDKVRGVIPLTHYAYRTEQSYLDWIRRFFFSHNKIYPKDMGEKKEFDLPTWLFNDKRSTLIPTVMTPTEVCNVLQFIGDNAGLIARLLDDKGMHDRPTLLPFTGRCSFLCPVAKYSDAFTSRSLASLMKIHNSDWSLLIWALNEKSFLQ